MYFHFVVEEMKYGNIKKCFVVPTLQVEMDMNNEEDIWVGLQE